MTEPTNPLNAPWSLHFDRDGTEDFGIICDAGMNDLVASHLPQTNMPRWKDREFGDGCFWLPEEEGDEVPLLVRQMQAMAAAPRLLAALKAILPYARNEIDFINIRNDGRAKDEAAAAGANAALAEARAAIAEAEGVVAPVPLAGTIDGESKETLELTR